MTFGRYILGIAGLALVVGPVAYAAVVLRVRWLAGWAGPPARVAEAVIAIAMLLGIAELVGLVGLLRPGPLVAASLACGLAAWSFRPRAGPDALRPQPPMSDRLAVGFAVVITAAVVGFWFAGVARSLRYGMGLTDSLTYHAPMAATFVQEHSTAHHLFPTGEQVLAFVPANSELLHAIGILVMGNDVLSPLLNLGWLALALVSAWAIGRPFGHGPATLSGAVIALATRLLVAGEPGQADNDVAVVACLLAVAALLVNRQGERAPLVLGCLAAGLAAGTKATALLPGAVFAIAVIALIRTSERWKTGSLAVLALVAGGGFWYLRNFAAFGNPLPTVRIGIGPLALPSITARRGYTVFDYSTDWHVWDVWFLPALRDAFGPAWWALVALATLGVAVSLVRRSSPEWRVLGILAIAVVVFYAFTPYSADGPKGSPYYFGSALRYVVPALALGLAILPLAASLESRSRQRLVVAVFGVVTLTTLYDSRDLVEQHALTAALAAAVLVMSVAAAPLVRRLDARLTPRGAGLAAGLALLVLGAGLVWQTAGQHMSNRYPTSWARTLHDARIGTAGTVYAYPLYGRDLSNRVRYVARRGPHGAFRRIHRCREWRRAVEEAGFGYVAIGSHTNLVLAAHGQADAYTEERAWTVSDPAAVPLVGASRQADVFRIDGPLDPNACDRKAVRRAERDLDRGVTTEEVHRRLTDRRFRSVRLTPRAGSWVIRAWSGRDVPAEPGAVKGFVERISAAGRRPTVTGWAADTDRRHPAEWVLAFADGRLVAASQPSLLRPDVADDFGAGVELCGYMLTLPRRSRADLRDLRVFGLRRQRASELLVSDAAKRELAGS